MPERSYTRRDTVLFALCLGLSIILLFSPSSWGQGLGALLRQSVLAPLVMLQTRAEEGKTSRARLDVTTVQRDSLAILAQTLPALRLENERLRRMLELGPRVTVPYVPAEVLHQTQATDGRALLLGVGSQDGVTAFAPVVAPEGLIGVVLDASSTSSVVMTWAHPEFRISAYTEKENASGIVGPSPEGEGMLEFRGVPYRDSVPEGTLVMSSGLGGVYPKGIPIGTVAGVVREQAGWERVYRLRPAADPSVANHVLVLTAAQRGDLGKAFLPDTVPTPMPPAILDSSARTDSAATAARGASADTVPATP